MDGRELWSAKEAAWFLGISPVELDQLREEGKLTGIKRSWRGWLYAKEDIEAWSDSLPRPEPIEPLQGWAIVQSIVAEMPESALGDYDGNGFAEQAPLIRLVNAILVNVIDWPASELLFEPAQDGIHVRWGTPDFLLKPLVYPRHLHRPLINRLAVLANLDMGNLSRPQVGTFGLRHNNRNFDCRITWTPAHHGGKIHARIHERTPHLPKIYEHLWPKFNALSALLERKEGMVLFVGPPGSGKTTMASGLLRSLETYERVIHTLEWPIELNLKQAIQTERHPRNGPDPVEAAYSAIRSGADLFFLGAVDDSESAQAAFLAVEAGLGVATTMSIARPQRVSAALLRLGIDLEQQQAFVKAIIASRRLACLCPYCRLSLLPSVELQEEMAQIVGMEIPAQVYTRSETGCSECQYTGLKGSVTTMDWWNLNGTAHPSVRKGVLWAAARGLVGVEELT